MAMTGQALADHRPVQLQLQLRLIVDNYQTYKHPNVNAWLQNHPRFHLHFTPTSSSASVEDMLEKLARARAARAKQQQTCQPKI